MANLKEIRDRIVSVKNTRKITEAMRLVAAAKVRRAQEQVLRSRPFADRLARVLENIQTRMRFEMADVSLERWNAQKERLGRFFAKGMYDELFCPTPGEIDLILLPQKKEEKPQENE